MNRTTSKSSLSNSLDREASSPVSIKDKAVIDNHCDVVNITPQVDITQCPLSPPEQNKVKRICLKIAGLFFVGLAVIGAILPVLPTTVFLIVATACFAKSSPRMEKMLLTNKTFGPLIYDWQTYRSIPRKAKRTALVCILLSVAWSSYLLQDLMLIGLVVLLVTWPVIFIWRLPLTQDRNKESS